MQNFEHDGKVLKWTNGTGSAVAAGDVVVLGNLVGVACVDIANGGTGAVLTEGVVRVTKASGSAWTQGEEVFYHSGNDNFTGTATDAVRAGAAAVAAGSSATSGYVKLNTPASVDVGSQSAKITDPASAAALTQDSLTDSSGGTRTATLAAATNTTNLTDSGGGTADGTVDAQAAPTTLTDNSGGAGTHDDTLAAVTPGTAPAITYTSNDPSITPNAAVTINDGSSPSVGELLEFCEELKDTAGDNATAIGVLMQNQSDAAQKIIELVTLAGTAQNNLKEVTTELATQRSLNTVLINAVSSLAAQLAKVKTDVAAVRTGSEANNTAIDSIIDALEAFKVTASA